MPSRTHEAGVELVRVVPALVPDLLVRVLGVALPAFTAARVESGDLSQLKPTEYRADNVVTLVDEAGEPVAAVVVEVQLSCDPDKRYSWPAYLATLRSRWRCDALLVVIACDPKTAQWCATGIHMGHPHWVLQPLVIGPNSIPVLTDLDEAGQRPWLAVLSSWAHHDHQRRDDVFRTLLTSLDGLEADQAASYVEIALAGLPDAAQTHLEKLMETDNYKFRSNLARRHYGQGLAEGEAKGEAKGLAEGEARGEAKAILTVLATRGLDVPAKVRKRITACVDTNQLTTWLQRAVTVHRADDLFA